MGEPNWSWLTGLTPIQWKSTKEEPPTFGSFLKTASWYGKPTPCLECIDNDGKPTKQTGLVALASIDEYDRGIIKKHELTKPVKEKDRVRVIETHESQSGPVLLFFRRTAQFENWLTNVTTVTEPDFQFTADNGVEHTVWSLRDHVAIEKNGRRFQEP